MSDEVFISTAPPPLTSMQFGTLLQMGLDACQTLGGDIWTDYNEHDPGVTILEQLCYATTDLGYRVNYPVADILADKSVPDALVKTQPAQAPRSTPVSGNRILSCNPLTEIDYRKFAFDRARYCLLNNFKNLWMQPATSPSNVTGRYDILIETWDGKDDPTLAKQIRSLLMPVRNLDIDFASFKVMAPCDIPVEAIVSISSLSKPEEVLAEILFQLQDTLVPFVLVSSTNELMAQGVTPDLIFTGPLLKLGVIADKYFAPISKSISLTDLNTAILQVPGVLSVGGVNVNGSANGSFTIPESQVPRLFPSIFAPCQFSLIRIIRQGKPCEIDTAIVNALLAQRIADIASNEIYALHMTQKNPYCVPPKGQSKNIAQYYSIQRQFPLTYGIGAYGIQLSQTKSITNVAEQTARIAQAQQLKAFLLFFEQILCDGLAQLSNAARLFSLERDLRSSYFWQSLVDLEEGPPDLLKLQLLKDFMPEPEPEPDDQLYVVQVTGTADLLLRSPECKTAASAAAMRKNILEYGQDIRRYQVRPLPNSEFRLLLSDDQAQVIGFGSERYALKENAEQEIERLAMYMRELAQNSSLCALHVVTQSSGILGIQVIDDLGQILLKAEHLTAVQRQLRVAQLLELGVHNDNYQISASDKIGLRLRLCDRHQSTVAQGVEKFATEKDARRGIDTLVALFQNMCRDPAAQKRHILLVPKPAPKPAYSGQLHYELGMEALVRESDPFVIRRNRFLNHLLARFGESFSDARLCALYPYTQVEHCERKLIDSKIAFLSHYPLPAKQYHHVEERFAFCIKPSDSLGAARSRGHNYEWDITDTQQTIPIARRIKLLLNFQTDVLNEFVVAPQPSWQFLICKTESSRARINSLLANGNNFVFSNAEPGILQALLKHGSHRRHYSVEEEPSGAAVFFSWPNHNTKTEVYRAASAEQANVAVEELQRYLRGFAEEPDNIYAGEELFVVEHIQLHPLAGTDKIPSAFYSHRLSFIFPGASMRFQDHEFRDLAEQIVDENCPAHLLANCHWLDTESMKQFISLHQHWSKLKHEYHVQGVALTRDSTAALALDSASTALAEFILKLEQAFEEGNT